MLRVSGTGGAVRVGYQTAADVGAWTLEQVPSVPRAYRFRGRVRTLSEYWFAQTPLDLRLEVGAEWWTWRGVTPALAQGELTVTLRAAPQVTAGAQPATEAAVWVRSGR